MATDKKGRAKEHTTSLLLRRSGRHHHQILAPGSSLEPIIIPDSSPLRPRDNEKHDSTTTVNKESELIQIIPEDAVDSDKRPAQIRVIDANKELIQLIRAKQSKLLRPESQSHGLDEYIRKEEDGYEGLKGAVDATLVFAQEEAVRPSPPSSLNPPPLTHPGHCPLYLSHRSTLNVRSLRRRIPLRSRSFKNLAPTLLIRSYRAG
jgi:hypothetical protein